ncbi:MAG TPA: hypothetical protein VMX58_11435 [Patescibacteria group bacterium]|nr:hypothetical protein [Patescibacteria group bacterium]
MRFRVLFGFSLVMILLLIGCVERKPVTVLFTSDVKGRIRPAG